MNRRVKDHLRDSSMEYKTSDFLFVSEFAAQPKEGSLQSVSLMDICSGDLAHLNLKHVSRLESQLHKLHERKGFPKTETEWISNDEIDLAKLQCSLDTCLVPNLLPELQEHAKSTLDDAQTELLSSLNSLLSLLVLIPSAPCPHLDKVRVTGLPTLPSSDEILAQLPNLSSSVK